jgi:hypothetical protein
VAPGYGKSMLIGRGMCVICVLVVQCFGVTCPDETTLDLFKHEIAYEKTEGSYALMGLPLIHTNVWVRGSITGFYIREQLRQFTPRASMTYLFGPDGPYGGGSCPVTENWRACIEEFAGAEHGAVPLRTCTATINVRAIPAWRPSPNSQKKKQTADELRREIEAKWGVASEIVIRDFNLKDNEITVYMRMPDGDFYQGCGFNAMRQPHSGAWHSFGQSPLSSIRKWILERPYRLK